MPNPRLFIDSSALMAGIISSQGATRALLLLAEDQKIDLVVSEQVIVEVERNIARKIPKALIDFREAILRALITIFPSPTLDEVQKHLDWITHQADVPILVAAVNARVDYLVTLNSKHFLDDQEVTRRCGLKMGTPGDALAWVREQLTK